ncbi:cytochrome P450 [Nonomuraea jabiensis]|uniref:cytochrome P450 n=1 Tax=Nonomuraea jabiensis TaxID=882448 RepID=UPI003D7201B2
MFNPFDYALHEDPYPTYARMRREAPLYRHVDGGRLDFWALSRHEDVRVAFRDPRRYSSTYGAAFETWGPKARARMSFLSMDPPEHDRMRRLISSGFTPRRVQELEPRIQQMTRRCVAAVIEAGEFDFVTDFAERTPVDVISELMGVPSSDREEVLRLTNVILQRGKEDYTLPDAAQRAHVAIMQYYGELIADRHHRPGDDLISALIAAEIDGQRLSDDDIRAACLLLGVAGNETTTKLLANAWFLAAVHPDQRATAFSGRIGDWIEETLRFEASTQVVLRLVTEDVDWYGQTVPAGSQLVLLPGSANRDPEVFPDPDRYDLDRDTSRMLTFGSGPHFCLGAALARLEARLVLEELVHAVQEDYEVGQPVRMHSPNVRGYSSLPTRVKPR